MTEQRRLISYSLYGLLALEKMEAFSSIRFVRARGHSGSCSLIGEQRQPSKPEGTVENETILSLLHRDLGQI